MATTRYFNLPLQGEGTAQVETASSYLGRLAQAHRVAVNVLLRDIGQDLEVGDSLARYPSAFGKIEVRSLNGLSGFSAELMPALCRLTGNDHLQTGSWLFLRRQVAGMNAGVQIGIKRWCPACYAEDLERAGECYDRLIWQVPSLTRCPLHERDLLQGCPRCGHRVPALQRPDDRLRCRKCRASLVDLTPSLPMSQARVAWERWVAGQIAELFQHRTSIEQTSAGSVADFMRVVGTETGCRFAQLDSRLQLTRGHCRRLANGVPPTLASVLTICAGAGIDAARLLRLPRASAGEALQTLFPMPSRERRTRRVVDPRTTERRLDALRRMVRRLKPPCDANLKQLCAQVQLQVPLVHRRAPDVVERVATLRREWKRHCREQRAIASRAAYDAAAQSVAMQGGQDKRRVTRAIARSVGVPNRVAEQAFDQAIADLTNS